MLLTYYRTHIQVRVPLLGVSSLSTVWVLRMELRFSGLAAACPLSQVCQKAFLSTSPCHGPTWRFWVLIFNMPWVLWYFVVWMFYFRSCQPGRQTGGKSDENQWCWWFLHTNYWIFSMCIFFKLKFQWKSQNFKQYHPQLFFNTEMLLPSAELNTTVCMWINSFQCIMFLQ